VVSRRALLAGGALALLAGCGEEDEVDAAPADALLRQLAAESALAAATAELPSGAPRSAAKVVREVHARARGRAQTLLDVARAERGDPPAAPPDARVAAEDAVTRAQAAIVAHVVALPSLAGRELRALGAEMVTGAAADAALLGDALGVPVHDPFPGTPR
jgi:hypothetical protein